MNSPILSVLSKWVDDNSIVDALLHKSADFDSLVKQNVQVGTGSPPYISAVLHYFIRRF